MGFRQVPTVTEPGEWSPRGGIVDIWPPGQPAPVRLDLFGDVLDGLRRFDPVSQRTTEQLDAIELAPVSEVILDGPAITRFRQAYRIEFGAAGTDDPLYEAVSAGRKAAGMEHWLPFFHETLDTLADYFPGATLVMDDGTPARHAERWGQIADMHDNRREALTSRARLDAVYKPVPPDALYLSPDALEAALAGRRVLHLSPFAAAPGPGVLDFGRPGRAVLRAGAPAPGRQPLRDAGGPSGRGAQGRGRDRRVLFGRRARTAPGPAGGRGRRPACARCAAPRRCRRARSG